MHGRNFRVVACDSVPLPKNQQVVMNTITVNPREIIDIEFEAGMKDANLSCLCLLKESV
jgi:FtsP/CotA-like multicopper oxidase with cupredoxin domain